MLDAAAAQKMLDPLFPGLMDVRLMGVRLTALAPERVAAAAPRQALHGGHPDPADHAQRRLIGRLAGW